MKFSVIIPVWNGSKYLPSCLDALLNQNYPEVEIIAVDNNSTDDSVKLITQYYPQVRLICNSSNRGFAAACNVGIKASEGEMIALLNQDTRVYPNWLSALAEALRIPQVGLVGCKILYPDDQTIQHAGGWIDWPLGLVYHYGRGEKDTGQWDISKSVEFVTGAAIAFRRDCLDVVGFLDEEFYPGYYEDVDLCFRFHQAHYDIQYVPDAVLIHEETTSITDLTVISQAYQKGRLRFLLKSLPPLRLLTEWIPAEMAYHSGIIKGHGSAPLRIAYLHAALSVGSVLHHCWQADEFLINQVIMVLQELYQHVWEEEWNEAGENASHIFGDEALNYGGHQIVIPELRRFHFKSDIPIIGGLIAGIRSLLYNIASRWAVNDLLRQQELINRYQKMVLSSLDSSLRMLMRENIFLSSEIARFISVSNDRKE